MYLKDDSLYVSGLINMAGFNILPSFADAFCVSRDNFVESCTSVYGFSAQNVELVDVNVQLEELFREIFNLDKKASETLVYWMTKTTGKHIKTYTSESESLYNGLSGDAGGCSGFFFLENIYFIEFEKMVACVMIGNNE